VYIKTIYIINSPDIRIEKLKKIWYHDNIDKTFDPEQAFPQTH
jgi:hypothetical protein